MTNDERTALIAQGWRQGAIIHSFVDGDFTRHSHITIESGDIFLVISQTCDLINPDFDSEPFCEVLRISAMDSAPAAEYEAGKNSREIHFEVALNGRLHNFRARPHERFFVDRRLLQAQSPDDHFPENKIEVITAWLTKRFVRTAFPDKFDQRWKKRQKQIERVIKRLRLVSDIYIKITPFEEVADEINYVVEIHLLMDADHYDDPRLYEEYEGYKRDLETQFGRCTGIDLQVVELVSNADMTVRELQELRRWDYSYLSYRTPDEHVCPSNPV